MGDTTCKVVNTAFRSCIPVCCCIAAVVGHAHADEHAGSIAAVDPAVIEEIVVTAQRREQPRQSVPLTVDAISGIELTKLRVHDLEKLGRYLPNVDIKRAFGAVVPLISIRGVSLQDFNLINNPAVGVYLDDVYLASTGMLDFAIFDVERLEVIKGPQGTLYGRNTTGGAINVIPRKPLPGFEAFVRLDVGDYDLREFEGVINGGGETLAMRLSAFSRRQGEGFVRNRVTGNDIGEVSIDAVRGQIAWQPVDTFSLRLNVHAGRNESDAASYEHVSLLDPVTFDICEPIMQGRVDPFRCVDIMGYTDTDLDPYTGDYNLEPVIDNATSGAALTVNWRRGGLELTSITGFEEFDRFQQDQTDANPFVQGELLI